MRNRFMAYLSVGLWLLASAVLAGDAGQESPFLTGAGARALGMGGGFTSIADDASTLFYNPAGLSNLEQQEVSLMHMRLFEGTSYNFVGWAYPDLKLGGVGIGYMRIGTDDIIRRENFVDGGTFGYSQSQFLIAYGKKLQGGLSMGLTFKIVNQSLDNLSDYGFGFDLGIQGRLSRNVGLGLIIRDMIPPELSLDRSSEITPVTVAGGLAVRKVRVASSAEMSASIELEKVENRSAKVHSGAELVIDGAYALRAGYDRDNVSFGAGLKYHRLKIDYAYKVMSYIEDSHRFSLSFLLGTSISEQVRKKELADEQRGTVLLADERQRQFEFYREKATQFYSQFRLDSALVYYQRALAFDEGNQEIVGTIAAIENSIRIQQEEQVNIRQTRTELQKSIEKFLTQAETFFAKRFYRAALDMLDLIVDIEPDHPEANRLKVAIQDAMTQDIAFELENAARAKREQRYLEALEAYNRVLEIDPNNEEAKLAFKEVAANLDIAQQLNKGIESYNNGDYEQARTNFEAVLAVDHRNAVAQEYLRKIDVSAEQTTTLEDLQKDKVVWQMYLDGLRYMRNKEYDKAIEVWEKVLEAYPNNVNTLNNIEQARLRLKSEEPK